jgi:hypothetical protein
MVRVSHLQDTYQKVAMVRVSQQPVGYLSNDGTVGLSGVNYTD